jgi:hypothetical protein
MELSIMTHCRLVDLLLEKILDVFQQDDVPPNVHNEVDCWIGQGNLFSGH